MSLLERAKFLLRTHRITPKKALGQNFMVDSSTLQRIVDYAALGQKDVTLDIGAGLGFLTRLMADRCESVVAVEADWRLVNVLREQLGNLSNVQVVVGDVLKASFPRFNKVVSVPPYYISSQLLGWLFSREFESAVLVFQKEFTERLVSSAGTEDYGWLAVVAYYYVDVELLDEVPKSMFYPQPEVDSIIARLKPRKPPPFPLADKALFTQLAKLLFPNRNKKVRNAVVAFAKSSKVVSEENANRIVDALPFRDKRVRELTPEDFGVLANALAG